MGLKEKMFMGLAKSGVVLPPRAAVTAATPGSEKRTLAQRLRAKRQGSRLPVEWTPDLARILELPRRGEPDFNALIRTMTARLKKPEGTQQLFPIQAWTLFEAMVSPGVVGLIGVGGGKSLANLLTPMVVPNCRRAVLFVPPMLKQKVFAHDLPFYGRHWNLPSIAGGDFTPGKPVLHVVAYSELSNEKATNLLHQLKPDTIIADEVHNLRHRDAVRTGRFLRYFANEPDTRFFGWSGTLMAGSLKDYAHLLIVALGDRAPVPLHLPTLEEWADALDPAGRNRDPRDPGEMLRLCSAGEPVRTGFRRRLVETPGVVATSEASLGTSLLIHERKVATPPGLLPVLHTLRREWLRPDGEELTDALRVTAALRELACGFFYRWRFPRGEPREVILDWFAKRQEWNRELRNKLWNPRPYLDSPLLCAKAAIRFARGGCKGCERKEREPHAPGCAEAEEHPLWNSAAYQPWHDVKHAVQPESEAVWLDTFLIADVQAWLAEHRGIVWVESDTLGRRLSEATGLPYYGNASTFLRLNPTKAMLARREELVAEGKWAEDSGSWIQVEQGERSVIASTDSHATGRDLQFAFNKSLVTVVPPAHIMEQLIGRTHRPGQPKDEVEVWMYLHTPELVEAFRVAQEKARAVQETQGLAQRLCFATYTFS